MGADYVLNRSATRTMTAKKQQILDLIRRLAAQNGGVAPGAQRFNSLTGIGKSEWYPKLWLRWGDAVREAGLQGNSMARSLGHELLIKKYIELIRELQRFPIEGDLIHKRIADKSFPNRDAFNALGGKSQRATRILEYCRTKPGHEDVVPFCETIASTTAEIEEVMPESQAVGYVYLVKHGSRREYKIGRTNNPLRREGEIRIELPEKVQPVHVIKTDDPAGVEAYWHARFADKRKEGEWFALTAEDVRAFKRWKRIY
jgi:hypothetical protein